MLTVFKKEPKFIFDNNIKQKEEPTVYQRGPFKGQPIVKGSVVPSIFKTWIV